MKNTLIPFTGDEWGSCSDMHVLFFPYTKSKNKKTLVRQYRNYIEECSYPSHVGSMYDCTGQHFGSKWKRLRAAFDDWGLHIVVEHFYKKDI